MSVYAGMRPAASNPAFRPPYFSGYQSSTQLLASSASTWTAITFNAENEKYLISHDTATNSDRIIPLVAGVYDCVGVVAWAASGAGDRNAKFRLNGANVLGRAPFFRIDNLGAGNTVQTPAWASIRCNGTTDYITLVARQNSGGNVATVYDASAIDHCFVIVRFANP